MPLNNPTKSGAPTSGTYTGNDGADRGIPHGLAGVPKFVIIVWDEAADTIGDYVFGIHGGDDRIHQFKGGAASSLVVTTPDSTNFYIGNATNYENSANKNAFSYFWVAFP